MRTPHMTRLLGCCCLIAACLMVVGARAWEASAQDAAKTESQKSVPASSPSDASTVPAQDAEARPAATAGQGSDIIANLTIFILAILVGFEVITKVPPTLHTPLMSGSNAISGITVVGAIVIAGSGNWGVEPLVGFAAVVLATINVVGGFLVTHRMLAMFRRN